MPGQVSHKGLLKNVGVFAELHHIFMRIVSIFKVWMFLDKHENMKDPSEKIETHYGVSINDVRPTW